MALGLGVVSWAGLDSNQRPWDKSPQCMLELVDGVGEVRLAQESRERLGVRVRDRDSGEHRHGMGW